MLVDTVINKLILILTENLEFYSVSKIRNKTNQMVFGENSVKFVKTFLPSLQQ